MDAAAIWNALLDEIDQGATRCRTHSSIVVEASALIQRRLGVDALADLHYATLDVIQVAWVDGPLHDRALSAVLAARQRDVSLVDWTSFEFMKSEHIGTAFAFDSDFADQGFVLLQR